MTTPKQAADRADEALAPFRKALYGTLNISEYQRLQDAIAAAIRSAEPQWRYDMENAPRDGQSLLLWVRSPTGDAGMGIAFCEAPGIWRATHQPYTFAEHLIVAWMPLPASPAPPEAISGKETAEHG